MNNQIIAWINSKFNYDISDSYYKYITEWQNWWSGYYKPFHRFKHNNGKRVIDRDLYSLKMGKKVCEDWASILLNSKTKVIIANKNTNDFIQGEKETDGVLGKNSFWVQANRLVERTFATGTGAVTIHINNVLISNDIVKPSFDAQIKLNFVSAEYIIPLSVDNGRITEAAFAAETTQKGKKYILLETHTKNEIGNYVVENYRFTADNDQLCETELPENIIARIDTGSAYPWFSILSTNIENDIACNNGLGVSILHGAIDALKAVDLTFNNFCTDFYLGQKKVFLHKQLLELEDGQTVAPDDVNQQLFSYIDKPIDESGNNTLIHEFNPNIRTDENTKGVQSALDYLSFKCGLGNKHYQFNSGTIVTATQYTGDKQDLIQNAHKHYIVIEEFMLTLIRSIIFIGKELLKLDVDIDTEIEIVFDKSVIIDENAERLQDAQDVRDGFMGRWEYRVKWYGETENEAKSVIAEIDGLEDDNSLLDFGGDS